MANIMNKDYESDTVYDNELRQIIHYKNHQEMLPFIGKKYSITRILLLGESHYVCPKDKDKILDNWYEQEVDSRFEEPWWFNTRHVVNNYLCRRRSKAHSMFGNPAKALIEAWGLKDVNDSEAFTAFAFMNYFQRPAVRKGKSIIANEMDKKKAFENLKAVVNVIKPLKVIFLSRKAFMAFSEFGEKLEGVECIGWTKHPTSKYWNDCDGKDKFKKIVDEIAERPEFMINGTLELDTAEGILKTKAEGKYFILEKRKKRFWEDYIGIRIYTEKDENYVSEIAWYYQKEEKRIGIGYMVKTRIMWIWDYNQKKYLTEDELSDDVKEKLEEIKGVIGKL